MPSDGGGESLDWSRLLSSERIAISDQKSTLDLDDHRTPFEKDFDRVVFSTPVRRLKDKTQVFPLDMHDGVRTRLTHSLEVSNLARSMGVAVADKVEQIREVRNAIRNVPSLLATVALGHDLGNPPFGHQGEEAIRTWVKGAESGIKQHASDFNADLFKDFLHFEGNAQGFRILVRLQHVDHTQGLNLTAATLRSFMKYPWYASNMSSYVGKKKKFGCFQSEKNVFDWASEKTGLAMGVRHPLSFLMEACDDIAYSVLDIEDGVKKELVTTDEVLAYLRQHHENDKRVLDISDAFERRRTFIANLGLRSKEVRDAQVETLRSIVIGFMVSDAISQFVSDSKNGRLGQLTEIAKTFQSSNVVAGLKDFAVERVYKHHTVIKAELPGHTAIPKLMSAMWAAIRKTHDGSATKGDEYVFSLLSKNYVRVYERTLAEASLPVWYRQLQLLCDQICGMTDSYAMRMYADLKGLDLI